MSFSRKPRRRIQREDYVPSHERAGFDESKVIKLKPMNDGRSFAWKDRSTTQKGTRGRDGGIRKRSVW